MSQQRVNPGVPGILGGLTGLAKTIALPHEFKPARYPSFPALERTAILGFSAPSTWNSTTIAGSNRFMLARQAAWPLWAEYASPTVPSYSIQYGMTGFSTGTPMTTHNVDPQLAAWAVGNVTATSSRAGISGAAAFDPGYPVVGVDAQTGATPFIYVPSAAGIAFMLESAATNTSIPVSTLTIDVWSSPGEYASTDLVCNNTGFASGVYGLGYAIVPGSSLGGNVWVRVRSVQSPTSTNLVRITAAVFLSSTGPSMNWTATEQIRANGNVNSITAFIPAVAPTEFSVTTLPWYATRTTASAALLTNVTQVLNKAGTFLGGRVSPSVINPFNVSSSYISMLHPAEKSQLSAEHGFYTFAPPSTDLANFWDYTINTVGGAPPCPLYRLDNDALVNVFFHTDPVPASYSITVDWHIEFRTSSALFDLAISTMPLEGLHQAQLALAQTGFFFNNWNHEKIKKIISNIAKHLVQTSPYGKMLMSAASVVKNIAMPRKPPPPTKPTSMVAVSTSRPRARAAVPARKKKVVVKRR